MWYHQLFAAIAIACTVAGSPIGDPKERLVKIPIEWNGPYKMPYAVVGVGGNTVKINVDTGSSDTYVHAPSSCQTAGCDYGADNYTGYDKEGFTPNGEVFRTVFSDGSGAELHLGSGPIQFLDETITVNFSVAENTLDKTDAKLGGGFIHNEAFAYNLDKPYLNLGPGFVSKDRTNRNAFGIGGDMMVYGGYDKNRVENLRTMHLVDRYRNGTEIFHFDVDFNSLNVTLSGNGTKAELIAPDDRLTIALDTGAAGMFLPEKQAEFLIDYVGANKSMDSPTVVFCAEEKLNSVLHFEMGGQSVHVPLKHVLGEPHGDVCEFQVYATPKASLLSLGTAIMSQYYWVFDLEEQVVKVGELKNADSTSHDFEIFRPYSGVCGRK